MTRGNARRGPTVRDVPPPRKSQSAAAPFFRWVFQWPFRFVILGLHRLGFRAWQLTLMSLLTSFIVGGLLLSGRRLVPGGLLLLAGLFDLFDGAIARLRGEESRKGALLDAVVDRVSDGLVLACIFIAEATIYRDRLTAGLALAGLIVSLLVSHIRAEAEAAGLRMTEGSAQRLERTVALVIGLMVPGALLPMLAGLTLLGAITVVQRVFAAWRGLSG